jgi:Flp pilus assembly pilin Flp
VSRLIDFLRDESGPTAAEYALLLGFILMVVIAAVAAVGNSTSSLWTVLSATSSTRAAEDRVDSVRLGRDDDETLLTHPRLAIYSRLLSSHGA